MNQATCLITALLIIRVVVGSWKSLIFDPDAKPARVGTDFFHINRIM